MKKLFTRFGKFAIVLIALDLAVAITIVACSALFLTGCGDEYILPEEDVDAALPLDEDGTEEDEDEEETEEQIRERELAELAAFEPYIDEDGMVHVSPWFAYPREVVEIKNAAETIEDPREISWDPYNNGGNVYTLFEEELVDVKYLASYHAPCGTEEQCYNTKRIFVFRCWEDKYEVKWDYPRYTPTCPEVGRY